MSGYTCTSPRCGVEDSECSISYLPCETLLQVFSYLPAKDIVACIGTCKYWCEVINNSESLWKIQCLTLNNSNQCIQADKRAGHTWKEIFKKNYGANGIKNLWKQGIFSNLKSYRELPDRPFCRLDTDSWGQILEWELERS
ncbi:F-box only protein 48-like [Mercenaria mercenaria]|uniref:F-box only protein 48-like n=1 Tax=Mercenaria mercenaria TaxID=6596 RepID=UPI00234F48E7|nr:F-box only protein 48-like [Mercenaria mercenaria]